MIEWTFWRISSFIRSYLYIWGEIIMSWLLFKCTHPWEHQLDPLQIHTRTHTNTDHFLWMGKGSYWRILSGKRTFSNKWWWTLDETPLLAHVFCLLNFQSAMYLFFCCVWAMTIVRLKRCRHLGFKHLDPPESTSTTKNLALIAFLTLNENTFLHVWRWETVCLLVLFGWECLSYVCLAHFLQEKESESDLQYHKSQFFLKGITTCTPSILRPLFWIRGKKWRI